MEEFAELVPNAQAVVSNLFTLSGAANRTISTAIKPYAIIDFPDGERVLPQYLTLLDVFGD